MAPNSKLLAALDEIGSTSFSGNAYRHLAPGRSPLSGQGAYLYGGRWNPPESFLTIYLAKPRRACIGEFKRMARGQGNGPKSFLPRELHTIACSSLQMLDLTATASRRSVGLTLEHIRQDDWRSCQAIGEAAHFLGFQGVMAPSATGSGEVLAVFEATLQGDQLEPTNMQELDPSDLE